MARLRAMRVLPLAGAALGLAAAAPAAQAAIGVGSGAAGAGLVAREATAAAASKHASAALQPSSAAQGRGRPDFHPGAPGIGDPYFPLEGNGGYDTQHYDLTFSYDPATDRLEGLARIRAKATEDLSRFDLDLQQLDVDAVFVNSRPASFNRDGQELQITPRHGIRDRSTFIVTVRYGGVPQTIVGSPVVFGSPYGFLHTDDGAFMGDEPNAASTWFPVSDHPQDKSAYTFRVTVPKGLGVVANGRLMYQQDKGNSTLWVWDEPDPMTSYLVTADIGRWLVKQGRTPGGIPEYVAVDPVLPNVTITRNGVAKTQSALDFFYDYTAEAADLWSQTFGPYPFVNVGAIADNATYNGTPLGFSLETQTKPVYSAVRSPNTIAHELAHMWFGDSVSVHTWDHIWLNEGFASFAEFVWGEHFGTRTAHEQFLVDYARPANSSFWQSVIADPQRDTMFNSAVYRRGGMTLQALREKINNDATFFRILTTWTSTHKYGTGTTPQFTALAERISGLDLDNFFRVWLYTPGKPTTW
jgi:aminopeptidase N